MYDYAKSKEKSVCSSQFIREKLLRTHLRCWYIFSCLTCIYFLQTLVDLFLFMVLYYTLMSLTLTLIFILKLLDADGDSCVEVTGCNAGHQKVGRCSTQRWTTPAKHLDY